MVTQTGDSKLVFQPYMRVLWLTASQAGEMSRLINATMEPLSMSDVMSSSILFRADSVECPCLYRRTESGINFVMDELV